MVIYHADGERKKGKRGKRLERNGELIENTHTQKKKNTHKLRGKSGREHKKKLEVR